MRALLPLLSLSAVAQALYFYIEGSSPKCFFEELPHDTLVVGHYTAEEFDEHRGGWYKHEGISVYISVDVRSSQNPLFFFSLTNPLVSNRQITGSLRQRPPRCFPAWRCQWQVHLHCSRSG